MSSTSIGKRCAVVGGAVCVFSFGLGAAAPGARAATLNIQYDISSSTVGFRFVGQPLTSGTMTLSYPAAGINGPVSSGPATLQTLMLNFATPSSFTIPGATLSATAPIQLALASPLIGVASNIAGLVAFSAYSLPAAFNMVGSLFCSGTCPSRTITGAFPVTTLFIGFASATNITGGGPANLTFGYLTFDDYLNFSSGSNVLVVGLSGNEVARTLPEPSVPLLHLAALAGLVSLASLRSLRARRARS